MNHPVERAVLILGANGRLGAAATRAFADAGWQVLAQARRAPAELPAGARALVAGLDDPQAIVAQAAGVRAVLHAVNPPYTRWAREALPLARAGMDIAQRLGAAFMLPGNVYNFGETMPALLQEDTPQRPSTRKGRIRFELEAELEARSARGLRSVVLRAGDFFGGGDGTWLDLAIAKSMSKGRLVYPGPTDVPHAWAYLPDLAQAFVALAGRDGLPAFSRFHFTGHTLTGGQLLAGLERAAASLGLAPTDGFRIGSMPWRAIRLLGFVVPAWREIAEMAYLWRVPHALDGRRLSALLGELPSTPLDAALRAAVARLAAGMPAAAGPPPAPREES